MDWVQKTSNCETGVLKDSFVFIGVRVEICEKHLQYWRWVHGPSISITSTTGACSYRLLSNGEVVARRS